MKLTPVGKFVLFIVIIGLAFGGYRMWQRYGDVIVPAAKEKMSAVPSKATLPPVEGETADLRSSGVKLSFPDKGIGLPDKPEVRMLVWAWNAQMGLMFANGGPQSTKGSLMCQHGVNLKLERQDDSGKMQEALIAFATDLKAGNTNSTKGAHFVCIMGDGSATFLKSLNDVLKRLGPEYTAKVIGSCGYSRGEDKFMGPATWKLNPTNATGGVVAGVLRDGDWNIAQKWLGDNSLPNNPDEKTWDPDALNWVNASDYIDAAQKYVAGYSEDRPVVHNGKRTGETKHITVQGIVTWTPGDVIAAQKKGGLVSIVSTREYTTQMPNVIIGIDKWMTDNRETVEGMLQGMTEGGELVRGHPDALKKASEISQQVYKEQGADPAYWEKYYHGVQEKDATGTLVELGGSMANTLSDNLLLFGLVPGSANLFAATYSVFGDIVVKQYPELVPGYYSVSEVTDTSYLQNIAKSMSFTAEKVQKPQYESSKSISTVVSRKAWNIRFNTGNATFTADAEHQLSQLRKDLLVASGTVIEIHGHTDSVGSPTANQQLSEDRAFAVKKWLAKSSPVNFPDSRFRIFAHGQTNPIASNSTPDGRAANRRVEIVLGTTAGGAK